MQVKAISICVALSLIALTSAAPTRRSTLSNDHEVFPDVQSQYTSHKDGLTDIIGGADIDDKLEDVDLDDNLEDVDLDDNLEDVDLDDNLEDVDLDDNLEDVDLDDKLDDVDLDDKLDDVDVDDVADEAGDAGHSVSGHSLPVVGSVLGGSGGLPVLGSVGLLG